VAQVDLGIALGIQLTTPGIDVEDYFSDWDYYSDDYHDDDATVDQSAERKRH
jgi:hypothetical protein